VRLVLDAAIRAAGRVPEDKWEMTYEHRPRPLRELVRHLFHVVEASVDADVLGVFPAQRWLEQVDVPYMTGRARLLRYGETVRAKFDSWYSHIDEDAFARTIDADVGPRHAQPGARAYAAARRAASASGLCVPGDGRRGAARPLDRDRDAPHRLHPAPRRGVLRTCLTRAVNTSAVPGLAPRERG
jgi:hypothetical protein